jgi:hypothetical protein
MAAAPGRDSSAPARANMKSARFTIRINKVRPWRLRR